MNEWQFLAAALVPVFGFLGALAQRERTPGQFRRMREAAAALKDLDPSNEAHAALSHLVAVQAAAIAEREARKLNVTNLVMSIIVSAFAGWGAYGLSVWAVGAWGTAWGGAVVPLAIVIGLVLALFVGASFSTLYNAKRIKA